MSVPTLLRTGVVIPGVMSTIAALLQSSPGLAPVSISATRHVPWTKHPVSLPESADGRRMLVGVDVFGLSPCQENAND